MADGLEPLGILHPGDIPEGDGHLSFVGLAGQGEGEKPVSVQLVLLCPDHHHRHTARVGGQAVDSVCRAPAMLWYTWATVRL